MWQPKRFSAALTNSAAAEVPDHFSHAGSHARRLLQDVGSELAQNITVPANGFHEEFDYFDHTDLVGYNLPPAGGSCSSNSQLDQGVADCANTHQFCCFNASQQASS